jgi:hypothetical protein
MTVGPSVPLFPVINYPPENYLLGVCRLKDRGRWYGCCALLLHAHLGSPRDGIVPKF